MRQFIFLLLTLCVCSPALSQVTISGNIVDGEDAALPGATAMLMNSKDSLLVNFSLSDSEGNFLFKKILKGQYYVQVTYLEFDMLRIPVEISDNKEDLDLGKIIMTPEGTRLESVEITAEIIPIQIKGDTIEYNTAAFDVQANDKVEDLLKQLPGVEVDDDGNIKAQGEDVEKILVDGKEFFGDDPKTASKNLPADAVDKVQVFDKLSDMAEFTGVDDGTRSRTINLALKDDRKTGYFGNVEAGYGTQDRYQGKANVNRFTPKSQVSFLGNINNTNTPAFSFRDYINFMGGFGRIMGRNDFSQSGNGFNQLFQSASAFGVDVGNGLNNNGIQTSGGAGLNFNQDIGKNWEVSASYFLGYLQNDLDQSSRTETITDSLPFVTDAMDLRDDENLNHNISAYLKVKVDSASQLIYRGSARISNSTGISSSDQLTTTNMVLRNQSLQDYNRFQDLLNSSNRLLYRRRLGKPGRSIAIQGDFSYQDDQSDAFLLTEQTFLFNGLALVDTLTQDQLQTTETVTWAGEANYTEPLGKGRFLQAKYNHTENNYYLDKDFFDLVSTEQVFNDTLSNEYRSVFTYDRGGLTLQQNRKKYNFSFGLDGQRTLLNGNLIAQDTTFRKEFINALPFARFRYEMRQGRNFRINYSTQVNTPDITQLQPVVDNSNPLNLYQGNPDLRAEYSHNLNGSLVIFDQFSFTSLFLNLGATYTRNKISNATTISPQFIQVTQPINVDQDLRVNTNVNYGMPIRKLKVKFNVDGNVIYNRGITFINAQENLINRLTTSGNIRIENRKKKRYDLSVGTRLSHNLTAYDLNTEFDQSYLNAQYYGNLSVNFWKKFRAGTSIRHYEFYNVNFSNQEPYTFMTAYIERKLLPSDKMVIKLYAFDALAQNVGVTRTADLNFLQETSTVTLTRYYMLSVAYNFVALGRKK